MPFPVWRHCPAIICVYLPGGRSKRRLIRHEPCRVFLILSRKGFSLCLRFLPLTSARQNCVRTNPWRYGAFVHFNMQPFFSTPDEFCLENDPAHWNPSQLDVEQWFRCFWEAGFRYAVLTAKHTSDFCLWPTHTTASHVMNSPVKVDIVGEFVRFARWYRIARAFTTACRAVHIITGPTPARFSLPSCGNCWKTMAICSFCGW